MFERLTARARRTFVQAQKEARDLGSDFIGTEHILLALLDDEEGIVFKSIVGLDVDVLSIFDEIWEASGGGGERTPTDGRLPFTPRAKSVLELSLREALQLGDNHIGTEHLLLGLLRQDEGTAARMLGQRGINRQAVRQIVNAIRSTGFVDDDDSSKPPERTPEPSINTAIFQARFAMNAIETLISELEALRD